MREILLFGKVGREQIRAQLRERYQILTLRLGPGRDSDFNTWVDHFRRLLGHRWGAPSFDLLNVMCALRAADRYFVDKGMFRARRTIPIATGVTDAACWQRLREPLARVVENLSGDVLKFHPLALPAIPKLAEVGDFSAALRFEPGKQPDCVCLFSGGADSFAGAAHLLSKGRLPLFISHSVGPVSGLQKRLFDDLIARFARLAPEHLVQLRPQPNAARARARAGAKYPYWKSRDGLQRLRSAFFFSIAAIVARAFGLDEIFMCENGLIGAAIVFAPADDTPYTTRPAEPQYLRTMEGFLRAVFDAPRLSIRNPFQYMTKGEVLADAARLGFGESLDRTVSCWRSGNRGVQNCGQCVPCLFRQLAFSEAGLPPPRARYRYRFPIPPQRWMQWNSTELARLQDIRGYCVKVIEGGRLQLLADELAVVDAVDVTGGPVRRLDYGGREVRDAAAPERMADVILRFAEATLRRLP